MSACWVGAFGTHSACGMSRATASRLLRRYRRVLARRFWQIGKHVLGGKRRNPNAGWQHAYVAVDYPSRWGMVELRPREDAGSCTNFLAAVISAYTEQGITIRRVMTDNGMGYRSRRFRSHHPISHAAARG